ncbi:MAG: TlpA family protein disulfide reductase [Gammaproteobacteria bacterium]|nr:TlpA family protein disulfide reductase [Gammaproteobacteria bacterium]
MKFYQTILCCLGLSVSVVACAEQEKTCVAPKPFKLVDTAKADSYRLEKILDKTTDEGWLEKSLRVQLVNFWAAWCSPCRQELPFLEKIYTDKTATVTLINVGDKKEMAEKILSELNIKQLKTRLASSDILSDFSLAGLPASLVFTDKHVYLGMGRLKDEQAIGKWLQCLSTTN